MHLDRLSLLIIVGSKVIMPLICLARSFTVLCCFISDRLSCASLGPIRLLFRVIAVSLFSASFTQYSGCRHPFLLSVRHSEHEQKFVVWCSGWSWVCLHLAKVFIRSAIILILCFLIRHLASLLENGWSSVPVNSQAGSCNLTLQARHIATRFVLWSHPALSILLVFLFIFSAWGPLSGTVQLCRKGLTLVWALSLCGVIASMDMSVRITQTGLLGERFRYSLSQVISIALFLVFRSSRFRPPFSIGWYN